MTVCFNYFLGIAIFLNIDISQGSVATRLRCGGIFKYVLVTNLPVSLPVKEFWKSVNISGSYGQEFGVLFFSETQCRKTVQNQCLIHVSVGLIIKVVFQESSAPDSTGCFAKFSEEWWTKEKLTDFSTAGVTTYTCSNVTTCALDTSSFDQS